MNILYICGHNPYKIHTGAHQRTNLLCKALAKIGHVDVVCLENDESRCNIANCSTIYFETRDTPEVNQGFIYVLLKLRKILSFFSYQILADKDTYLKKIVGRLIRANNYDYIVIRYITNAIICGIHFNKKIIIDIDDLPENIYQSKLNITINNKIQSLIWKIYYLLLKKASVIHTKNIIKNVRCVYVSNKSDCVFLPRVIYLPNIPYPRSYKKNYQYNKNENVEIIFVGVLSWGPNFNGLVHFLENIWPIVLRNFSDIIFNIIGSGLNFGIKTYFDSFKNVKTIGYIDDREDIYNNNKIIIVPLYEGAGTNIKILEAMYFGKACVITSYACKGFEDMLIDGKNIFIAKSDNEFATKLLMLLNDYELKSNMGDNAKKTLDTYFSFDNYLEIVRNSILNKI